MAATAFLKPAGIAATKRPSVLATPAEDDVAIEAIFVELGAVAFDDVEVVVAAEAAANLDEDAEDPQPARASAAVAASATAP